MRHLHRTQRGSANWPFIITLILLLAFVYLWFDGQDDYLDFSGASALASAPRFS